MSIRHYQRIEEKLTSLLEELGDLPPSKRRALHHSVEYLMRLTKRELGILIGELDLQEALKTSKGAHPDYCVDDHCEFCGEFEVECECGCDSPDREIA